MSKKKSPSAIDVMDVMGIRTKKVEWPTNPDIEVEVRELSAQDFAELGVKFAQEGKTELTAEEIVQIYPGIVTRCVTDGNGDPVFTEGQVRRIRQEFADWMFGLALTALELSEIVVKDDEEQPEKNA